MRVSYVVAFAALLLISCSGPSVTTTKVKQDFNDALLNSDGTKLHAVLTTKELNGATPDACTKFLELVVKPRLEKIGALVGADAKFKSIADKDSTITLRFKDTGGAEMIVQNSRTLAFETPVFVSDGENKSMVGFATLAFWAAHVDARETARGTVNRAGSSQNLVESWIPEFEKMGIKGSIDPETRKYMTWKEIINSSQQEIDDLQTGRKKT